MALTGISANRLELLQIADAVAREKSIEKEIVIEAIEEAITKGARSRYGAEHDIRAKINPNTGELALTRYVTVVEDDAETEGLLGVLRLSDALRRDRDAVVGKIYEETLPPFEFGRVQTQMARQVVTQKVREAERERQYEDFKDRVGEIVNGVVKRVEYGNVIADLGRGEGIIRRDEMIPRENMRYGDRVRAYVYDVRTAGSWPSCSPRKCLRSTTASSKSAQSRGTRAAGPRWPSSQMTARSIQLGPAWVCAAAGFRLWSPSSRAKRSTSFHGARMKRPSSSTPWRQQKFPRS